MKHPFVLYEGGIHSPFFARWPGKIAAGTQSEHISAFWDILPTMAELTGQTKPSQADGISMLPALLGNESEQKKHDWLYWEVAVPGQKPQKQALRMGDWKAVKVRGKKGNGALELYDLKTDIGETKNVAAGHPDIVAKMESIMGEASIPLKK
jgi:arylsulfatase A